MPDPISVLLVDDHALVRRGFRRLLEDEPDINVLGEAGTGDEAIHLTAVLKPRVVIMDCAMPGMNGLAATRTIVERWPTVAVLVISMHNEPHLLRQAMEAGARGYVLKEARDPDLVSAVRRVASGETVVAHDLSAAEVLTRARAHGLSVRQLEVLTLICNGLSSAQIGRVLGVSIHTVGAHRANIMRTLGVHRAGELAAYSIRHGLVTPR